MEDRRPVSGDAGPVDESGAALRRLDVGLLIVLWVGTLLGWRLLRDRMPTHFGPTGAPDRWTTHGTGGLLLWLLLPVLALLASLGLRWAGRHTVANPSVWNIPRKREFLALDPRTRSPIIARLLRFLAVVMVTTTMLLGISQLAVFLSATGRDDSAVVAVWTVFGLTALILLLALRLARKVSREIDDAARTSRGDLPVARMVALLAIPAALGLAACAGSSAPEAGEQMPVRAYPESGVAPDPAEALREELLAMGAEDQSIRQGLTPETIADTAFVGRLMRTDSALSLRFREIVAEHGWPDASRVGPEAVHAAFLIVQHTPFDAFREAMLPHVERSVRDGVLDGQDYAVMFDRIRTHRGEPQRYGTQYSMVDGALRRDPVEDPERLDDRRAGLGLMPIAEYERLLSEFYDAPIAED